MLKIVTDTFHFEINWLNNDSSCNMHNIQTSEIQKRIFQPKPFLHFPDVSYYPWAPPFGSAPGLAGNSITISLAQGFAFARVGELVHTLSSIKTVRSPGLNQISFLPQIYIK